MNNSESIMAKGATPAAIAFSQQGGAAVSQVNPDPHSAGYVYQPTHAVTANFPREVDVQGLQRELADAGFAPDQAQVFQGEAGASFVCNLCSIGGNHGQKH
jgi:hypothetical protein